MRRSRVWSRCSLRRLAAPIVCIALLVSCTADRKEKIPVAVLGVEPLSSVEVYAGSLEAFPRLALLTRGTAVLLHLSSRGNLAPVPEHQLPRLRDLVAQDRGYRISAPAEKGGEHLLTDDNYLSVAARLGLIQEIYWVLPSRLLEYSDAERRVKALLATAGYGLSPRDIGALQYAAGCVSGPLSGVTVHICGVETLPAISVPVVLDLDAGFLPLYAGERGMGVLEGMKDFTERVAGPKIPVAGAVIRKTLREGTLSVLDLPGAEHIAAIIRDPAIVRAAPPELWGLQYAAALTVAAGTPGDAAVVVKNARKRFPDDPFLLMASGMAAALGGNGTEGEAVLSKLCAQDGDYCFALSYVGKELQRRGRTADADRFLARADRSRGAVSESTATR